MARTTIEVASPRWFRLRTVVFSHGWFNLPPFHWDEPTQTLTAIGRPLAPSPPLPLAPISTLIIHQPKAGRLTIDVQSNGRPSSRLAAGAEAMARRMLGLDMDLAEFYRAAGDEFGWAKRIGAGPLLRSASVFEDAVKMLATTNCSWSLTRQMITRLVDALGEDSPGGQKAFPTPERMAKQSLAFYRDTMRAGYRASYFRQFACLVASGEIDPEAWPLHSGTSLELAKQIRACPGFGQYAAENLCKLLGRFDGYGLDSWCLKKFPLLFGPIRGDVKKAIERRYRHLGRWKGLALWLDLTRDWHEKDALHDSTVSFANS